MAGMCIIEWGVDAEVNVQGPESKVQGQKSAPSLPAQTSSLIKKPDLESVCQIQSVRKGKNRESTKNTKDTKRKQYNFNYKKSVFQKYGNRAPALLFMLFFVIFVDFVDAW